MPRFKVDCRYESSADGEIDFSEDLEAVDKDVAVEIVLDTNTDEHFVVESVSQWSQDAGWVKSVNQEDMEAEPVSPQP